MHFFSVPVRKTKMGVTRETEIASQVVFLFSFFSPFPIFLSTSSFFLNPSSSSPELLRSADYRPIREGVDRQPMTEVPSNPEGAGFKT